MTHESFRIIFEPETRLTEAWRACGVELAQPRNPPWHVWRDDGTLVMTVWRDNPDVGRWIQWNPGNDGFRLAQREPGSIPGESERRYQKLRGYNMAVKTAARSGEPIIVLVLTHRRNDRGEFVAQQRGASVAAEAWNAWIGHVSDAGNLPYSVVAVRQYPRSPFKT